MAKRRRLSSATSARISEVLAGHSSARGRDGEMILVYSGLASTQVRQTLISVAYPPGVVFPNFVKSTCHGNNRISSVLHTAKAVTHTIGCKSRPYTGRYYNHIVEASTTCTSIIRISNSKPSPSRQ